MRNLLNIFKKKSKKIMKEKEWYTAEMITECGFRYQSGVRAFNEQEARELILNDSHKGNSILTIEQKNILRD